MPKHWLRIGYSGGNPHDDIFGLQQDVSRIVNRAGGGLDDLLWKPETTEWFVVVHASYATDLEQILTELAKAGYEPEVLEESLHSPEEKALRDAGESTGA